MDKKILFLVIVIFLSGCTTQSAYEQFVSSMDGYLSWGKTLEEMDSASEKSYIFFVADHRYLTREEYITSEIIRYHYARQFLVPNQYCYYYLDVNASTRVVVGWGFDEEFGDPRKVCGRAG